VTKVLLSFDTEDYVHPEAEEAVVRLATTLGAQGIQGCFCVAGQVAAEWHRRDSRDVIRALQAHEVDAHTWRHSWHPNIVEYCSSDDWHAGLDRMLREERYAFDLVMDVCSRDRLWAFVKPGNSLSAQAIYGYTLLGSPIFGDSFVDTARGRGTWYCSALNLSYDVSLERLFELTVDDYAQFDSWAKRDRIILYAHPCKLVLSEFWDTLNMFQRNPERWGHWNRSPRRPDAQVSRFFGRLAELLRRIRADGRFTFVTYEQVWRNHQTGVHRELTRDEALPMIQRCAVSLEPQTSGGATYSPAELFSAAAHFLSGAPDDWVSISVMGPITAPGGVPAPIELAPDKVREVARQLEPVIYVPASTACGPAMLGPGDTFRAMAQVLQSKDNATPVCLEPGPQLPMSASQAPLAAFSSAGQWCHPDEWTSDGLDDRLRWQSWTIRPTFGSP